MRNIYSLIMMIGAMGIPVAASTTPIGEVSGKGVKAGHGVSIVIASPAPIVAATSSSVMIPVRQPKSAQISMAAIVHVADVHETRPDVSHVAPVAHQAVQDAPVPVRSYSADWSAAGMLARVTAYWPAEGDYYTSHGVAATGVHLHDGHCAVDPAIIPYGSVVNIMGVGQFLAVDTGTAVVERTAAREAGRTYAERNAIVIDLFFESRRAGEAFASSAAKWAPISWWTPSSTASQAKQARSLFAEEDWTKIQNKQL